MKNGYGALLKMQLLSRLADYKPGRLKALDKKEKRAAVAKIIAILFLIVYLGGLLIYVENSAARTLARMGMPEVLLSLTVLAAMMCTLVLSFFFTMSTLYFGKDAAFLYSLPITPRAAMGARLTQIWLSETGINALFVLPAAVFYGIYTPVTAAFYLRVVLVWLASSLIPLAIVTFISTLLVRLTAHWKKREAVTTVFGILFLISYMYLSMTMGGFVGASVDDPSAAEMIGRLIADNSVRIQAVTSAFPPAGWAVEGMTGSWSRLAAFLLVSAGAFLLAVYLVGFVYQKLSMLHLSSSAAITHKRGDPYAQRTPLAACLRRELKVLFRTSPYMVNSIPSVIMPAFLCGIMLLNIQNSGDGDSAALVLASFSPTLLLVIVFGMIGWMAGINPFCFTAVTREGKGHGVLVSLPVQARVCVRAKLRVGYALSAFGVVLAGAVLLVLLPEFAAEILTGVVLALLYSFIVCCVGLGRDIRKPSLDWLTETEAIKQKGSTLFGMLFSWGVLLAVILLGVGGYLLEMPFPAVAAVLGAVCAAGCALSYRSLLRTADRYYLRGV